MAVTLVACLSALVATIVVAATVPGLSGLARAALLAAGIQVALLGWTITSRDRTIPGVVSVAFLVRALCALVTEVHPVFPEFYYDDARKFERLASVLLAHWQGGADAPTGESCDHMNYIRFVAGTYWLFGEQPAVVKIVNSLIGSLVPGVFSAIGGAMFGSRSGAVAGWTIALWPSAVFWSSQNFRESAVALGIAVTLLGVTRWIRRRSWRDVAVAACGLLAVGLFRSYGVVILLLAVALSLVTTGRRGMAGLRNAVLGVALAGVLVLVPEENALCLPTLRVASPDRVSAIRSNVIDANLRMREVGTILFQGRTLSTWRDTALALPEMAFWVAFMPLPGAYPLEGRIGRMAAAMENVLLLALAVVAAVVMFASARDPAARYLIYVLGGFLATYALLEPDLGSAMRHKPTYMAIGLLFAAHGLVRLRRATS